MIPISVRRPTMPTFVQITSMFLAFVLMAAIPVAASSTQGIYSVTESIPSDTPSGAALHRRLQKGGSVVTTATCDKIRVEPFRAMLELEFYYMVEYEGRGGHDLEGVESAVMRSTLDALHSCDSEGYPQFALDLQSNHQFTEEGEI